MDLAALLAVLESVMHTTERSITERGPPSSYDGFISYSHAADDLLAPRLQAGLQKFAKPWWKRRAVRIFRDESSLAANPHLWSSITEALEDSSWFVLLLSPDAANSEWVGKEIEHWVINKPADRILPVVTDGEFGWEDGDVTGSSVPSALHGVFTEEPRWVDLRFAHGEEHLDLQNPDFSAAVADVASAIRGVPKDELASEEVKQHRRTVRTAWAAGIAVAVLAIASIVAGVFAVGQRNDARNNAAAEAIARRDADANATLAEQNASLAEEKASEALANAEEASRNAALAEARELAASAINILDSDPELAILLTLEAIEQTPAGEEQPAEVIDALWQAVQEDRLVRIIDTGIEGNLGSLGLSPDGSALAVPNHGGPLMQMYAVPEGRLMWELRGSEADRFISAVFSPDGAQVVVGGSGPSREGVDGQVARALVLDAAAGSEVRRIDYPECAESFMGGWWSHDGSLFFVSPFSFEGRGCPREGAAGGWWMEVLDGESFEPLTLLELPPTGFAQTRFDQSGRMYVLNGDGEDITIHDPPDYAVVNVLEGVTGYGDVTPDGSTLVVMDGRDLELAAYDTETGAVIDRITPLEALPFDIGLHFSGPDGWFVYPSEGESTFVWNLYTGTKLYELHSEFAYTGVVSPDGRWMYTGHPGGLARVWDLGPAIGFEEAGDLGSFRWVNGNSFFFGPDMGAFAGIDFESPEFSRMFLFDPATGALVGDPVPFAHPRGALADGRFLSQEFVTGAWKLVDPTTVQGTIVAQCTPDVMPDLCAETGTDLSVHVSVDGSELMKLEGGVYTFLDPTDLSTIETYPSGHFFIDVHVFSEEWVLGEVGDILGDGDLVIEDRSNGAELARVTAPANIQVSATDSTIVIWNELGLQILDTATWQIRSLDVDVARVRGLSVDWDRGRFALGDENGLHVFDLQSGERLADVPMPSVSDIHWLDEDTVVVGTNNGLWVKVPLETDDLIASAAAGVTRGFTSAECDTYRIEPCSTLDEIRRR